MKPDSLKRLALTTTALACTTSAFAAAPQLPSTDGLCVWLDASDAASMECADGAVTRWRDKSSHSHDATASGKPTRVEQAFSGKAAVRFSGKDAFTLAPVSAQSSPLTVFVVSQRLEAQASGSKWQRLVSVRLGTSPDNRPPNICLSSGEASPAYAPNVRVMTHDAVAPGALAIGGTVGGAASFRGDIAEVLIYNRGFLSEGALRDVMEYLAAKWGAKVAREDAGWTRTGPLEATPMRVSDVLPLADQTNREGWRPVPAFTDEFNSSALDTNKWTSPARWQGRPPALFRRSNVAVSNGCLTLAMCLEDVSGITKNTNFHTYTSSDVSTLRLARYGYYEIRARPMDSAGSSSFWFTSGLKRWSTEIDVFEIGGKAPGREHAYNMNAHVWRENGIQNHWSCGGKWEAPWRLAEAFHVYGFEWTPQQVRFDVDGVCVRSAPNTHWHVPMHLIFDSETMPDWFGLPRHEDLPSHFAIDYVRAWSRGDETETFTEDEANAHEWPPPK